MRDDLRTAPRPEEAPRPAGPSLTGRLATAIAAVVRGGRLVCGIPDYEGYVAHLRLHHPERPVPSFEEFFRARLDARYGKGGTTRCC